MMLDTISMPACPPRSLQLELFLLTLVGKGQHPMKPHRMRMVHDLIVNYDMHKKMDMCVCPLPQLVLQCAELILARSQNPQVGKI